MDFCRLQKVIQILITENAEMFINYPMTKEFTKIFSTEALLYTLLNKSVIVGLDDIYFYVLGGAVPLALRRIETYSLTNP